MYGTSARRPSARRRANRRAMTSRVSDEVVADADAITLWILGFDDGAQEDAGRVAISEIDERARIQQLPLRIAHDAHDRTRQHVLNRIDRVYDAELEGVEHDERSNGVDPGEIHEGLDEHRVH